MGTLEESARRRRRMGRIQEAVLVTVALAGIMLVAMAAPNVLQVLGGRRSLIRMKNQTKSSLSSLARAGFVTFEERNGRQYARITEAGKRELILRGNELFRLKQKPKRWDGRWRVVLFDVPERRRKTRDRLRATMRSMGFYRLQDSVWVYPYDCEDVLMLIKSELRLGSSVLYLIAEKLENDRHLKENFLIR